MTDTQEASATSALVEGGRLRLTHLDRTAVLHPQWLRERTQEVGQIEATNRQKLFTPLDLPSTIGIDSATVDGSVLRVEFTDGHAAAYAVDSLAIALGWSSDPEQPPSPEPWSGAVEPFPYVDWSDIGWSIREEHTPSLLAFLDAFYRHGFVVLRSTPTDPGTVERVADRVGYMSGNNFGWVFDVQVEQQPSDLAYTPIGLLAHTDQPYRRPVPGIQLLHCIRNDAPGGDSMLVDGLAAAHAIATADPEAHAALVDTEVEWRYDMITDTVVARGPVLEYGRRGRFRQIRFNTKIDGVAIDPDVSPNTDLDAFYRGRRWLTGWLNDPAHQCVFRLEPGDVMFMDNERVLHGRTPFDPSQGARHLQGCYIDHDGPDTMYRLAVRRIAAGAGEATK